LSEPFGLNAFRWGKTLLKSNFRGITMKRLSFAVLVSTLCACTFVDSALNGASDQAGRNVGSNLAGSAGSGSAQGAQPASYNSGGSGVGGSGGGSGMSAANMNPAFMNVYMGVIFNYAFSPGGYDVGQTTYQPGQYTRWSGKGDGGKGIQVERAHLFDDSQGRQWWKVKWIDDHGKTTILEGLLDTQTQKFVRMRARFPDDAQGSEMAVDQQSYYHPAQKLSPESVQGATRGVESVSVPAGTFSAKHVVFGGMDGSHEWWLDARVPGGSVKQLMKSPKSDSARWEMDLTAYGSDAQSELGTTR
jgi:hypothetical protein